MDARSRKLNTRSSEQALAAFVTKKAEIDTMLIRLQALSDDHFNYRPTRSTGATSGPSGTTPSCSSGSPTAPLRRASVPPDRKSRSPQPWPTSCRWSIRPAERSATGKTATPFATDEAIADLIEALGTAYLAAPNERVSRAIKVELDLLETLI
jgi:hypothetical protein